ncbi:hypothetical protein SVIOM74S_02269 [Streptomyces violarus]
MGRKPPWPRSSIGRRSGPWLRVVLGGCGRAPGCRSRWCARCLVVRVVHRPMVADAGERARSGRGQPAVRRIRRPCITRTPPQRTRTPARAPAQGSSSGPVRASSGRGRPVASWGGRTGGCLAAAVLLGSRRTVRAGRRAGLRGALLAGARVGGGGGAGGCRCAGGRVRTGPGLGGRGDIRTGFNVLLGALQQGVFARVRHRRRSRTGTPPTPPPSRRPHGRPPWPCPGGGAGRLPRGR